jgi:hypothetical protein
MDRQGAAAALAHWLVDTDLAGTRPGVMRIGMPAAERATWDAFWEEVKAAVEGARKAVDSR